MNVSLGFRELAAFDLANQTVAIFNGLGQIGTVIELSRA
jgi:hypothetical protein